MKKSLFVASFCFAVLGGAIELLPTSLRAENLSERSVDRSAIEIAPKQTKSAAADLKVIEKTAAIVVAQQPNNDLSVPAANSKSPQVELLNPGAEPRQQLRLKPAINVKETTVMTVKMDLGISTPERSFPPAKIPTAVMTFETEVTKIDSNGDIHYQFAYTNADMTGDTGNTPPAALEAMRSALKNIIGVKGSFIADDRGFYKGGNFILPEGGDNNLKQMLQQMSKSLEQLSSPLPAEAVGKGAQWRVVSQPNFMGMNLKNVATYELTDLDSDKVSLNITIEQQANSQNVISPQLPAGATATLKSLAARGQGQVTMQLGKLLPLRSTSSINSNSEMSVKVASSSQEVTIKTQMSMDLILESK
jgi:hypothetical protein